MCAVQVQIRGRIATGQVTLDTAISDMEIVDGPGGPVLVSVSGPEGGLVSYRLREDRLPQVEDQTFFSGTAVSGSGYDLFVSEIGGATRVYVAGLTMNGIVSYRIGGGGEITGRRIMDGATFGASPAVAAETLSGNLVLADPEQPGFSIYEVGSDDRLRSSGAVRDTHATHADMIGAVATVRVDGRDIVIVASQTEYGVTAYRMGGGAPRAGDSIGPSSGLGIMVPTDIAVAETAEGQFIIVASEPSRGESGALSVMRVDRDGGLTPTDHVLDTRDSRFGNVQRVETVAHDGHVYVVAAGGDGGITLFELMPDGRLVHLASVEGTLEAGLDDVTALEIAVVDDELQIFVATEGEAGITVLSAELSGRGVALVAGDGGDTLTGTGRDDILMDGDGADRLEGRGGADRYVLVSDGQTDRIVGFDPSEDILDLSGLPFLYDVARLEIVATSNGARITHRGETIILISENGRPLNPEAVRDAIEVKVNRSFSAPTLNVSGTNAADRLTGDWGPDTLSGNGGADTLDGGDGGDLIEGGRQNDQIYGRDGSDELHGGRGEDTIYGGSGADTIYGGSGRDTLMGQLGDDAIYGQGDDDTLDGSTGNDTLQGDLGNDHLYGGAGDDSLRGSEGNDYLSGDDGNDTLRGEDGDDMLKGFSDDDLLYGGDGADTLFGAASHDRLYGGSGNDVVNGQNGDDTVHGEAGNDTVIGAKGDDWLTGDGGDDSILGGAHEDTIFGNSGNDTIDGEGGFDLIHGDDGHDSIHGGTYADTIHGGAGNDTLFGDRGHDAVFGEDGNDRIDAGDGRDTVRGGAGDDWLDGGESKDSVTGDGGNDTLIGGHGPDTLLGGSGHDSLSGGNYGDTLNGGDGRDTLEGGVGHDLLEGGGGHDLLEGGPGKDRMDGGDGNDMLIGGDDQDRMEGGAGNDTLLGQSGFDTLEGGQGNDVLRGGGFGDTLRGGDGNDTLLGEAGHDLLWGDAGDDLLEGGAGKDTLTGGPGADVFVFRQGDDRDVIRDFDAGEDMLRLDSGLKPGGMSDRAFVERYAVETADGIELRFANGDTIMLEGFHDMNRLDDAIDFV